MNVRSETSYYYLCLAALALVVIAVLGIRRSRTGRVLVAIRENEQAASAYGVNPRRTTLGAFAISGFLAAFAGALFVHHQNGLQLDSYTAGESLVVFAMVVIGGLGSIPGALLGALFVRGVTWWLPVEWQILATGAGMLVVLLVFRGGFGAAFADLRDVGLRRVAARRGIAAPGLVAETPMPRRPATPSATPIHGTTDLGQPALLQVRGLDVEYDGVQVLFDVDFDVRAGEIVALLGTNGSGKSTLLQAVSGLLEPRHGSVTFDGRTTTRARPERIAALGVVQAPGGHGVFPSLTVADNLRLAAWTAHDRAAARLATQDARSLFPILADRAQEAAGNLSGGEQQMLTLAMALVARPRLLLIDELALGLSPTVLAHLRERLRALRAAGTTIVVVEQSIDLALELADRAYFLEKGTVRFAGPARELLDHPELVRAVFLGRPRAVGTPHAVATDVRAPRLEVARACRRFDGVTALDDVSFTIDAGEIVGVLGPNGAGKTTLFDVISGFVTPDTGRVVLHDGVRHDLTKLAPHTRARLGLGRSFQDGRLFPALTVRETVAVARERAVRVRDPIAAALHLPMVTRSEAAVRVRVDELLDLLALGAVADKFVHELSTGTRRIVDLACVLAHEPTLLLLDEPSSGIAQREAEALAPMLLDVRDSLSATLLVIEHDLTLLTAVSDRMFALDRGRSSPRVRRARSWSIPAVIRAYLGG